MFHKEQAQRSPLSDGALTCPDAPGDRNEWASTDV
jgi:hypothetical protein